MNIKPEDTVVLIESGPVASLATVESVEAGEVKLKTFQKTFDVHTGEELNPKIAFFAARIIPLKPRAVEEPGDTVRADPPPSND